MSETIENPINALVLRASPQPDLPPATPPQEVLPASAPQGDSPAVVRTNEEVLPPPMRRPKSFLMPEVARMALEGHSTRAIAKKLLLPRRTVDRWLTEQREQWAKSATEHAEDLFATTLARLEWIYREAMNAWRSSLADKQVTLCVAGDGNREAKTLVRTETQSGQPALLGKAIQAAKEICEFKAKHLERVERTGSRGIVRARRDLAGELAGLAKQDWRLLTEYLRMTPRRQPEELAETLNALDADEYRELRELVDFDYDRMLPPR